MLSERAAAWLTPRLWCVVVAVLILALGIKLSRGIAIETDILALLPATEQDPLVEAAVNRFNQVLSQRHLIVVGAERFDDAVAGADAIATRIVDVPGVAELEYRFDSDRQRALIGVYQPYQPLLLDTQSRELLRAGGGAAFLDQTLQMLYSPLVPVSSALLANDPLLLFYRFASGLVQGGERVSLRRGVLTAEYEGRHFVLIGLKLDRSPFSMALQRELLPALEGHLQKVAADNPALEILNVGVVRYAHAGVESAQREISTIGLGSLAGVIVLLWLVFRSPLPLLASLVPIGTGFLAAFTLCQWLFGSVHLLTLVFGASLIGISIDYSFHYFCDRLGGGADWTGAKGVRHIFNGVALGLLTSVLGYAGLCFAPFPGMREMALFSSVGLAAAFVTVICLFPYLAPRPISTANRRWIARAGGFAAALSWPRRGVILLLAALLVLSATGIARLTVNDDIRLLQGAPESLRQEERRVTGILGRGLSNQFLLVEGESPEQVLQSEELLLPQLNALQQQGKLERYEAIARQLPSAARQRENLALVQQQLLADPALLRNYADNLGLDTDIMAAFADRYTASQSPLSLSEWLASAAGKPWRHLWLGQTGLGKAGRGYASVIALYAGDHSALADLEERFEQVTLVDTVTDISRLLKQYRERTALLVMLSYAAIYALLCLRYGVLRALRVMLPPVLAVLLALALLGFTAQALNIFHILALLLVLGIGVDYTLFLEEGGEHRDSTLLAIVLSALTTLLSFGLLALSATPAVAAFGVTVLTGITVCLLLAPMLCGRQ